MAAFIVPRTIYHGLGSIENLKSVKGTKAVIVTGAGSMRKFGFIDKTVALLKEAGIASAVFDGVEADPSVERSGKGVEVFNREKPDLIIGLGGCSAIDAAKAMWVFYEYPDSTFEQICSRSRSSPCARRRTLLRFLRPAAREPRSLAARSSPTARREPSIRSFPMRSARTSPLWMASWPAACPPA